MPSSTQLFSKYSKNTVFVETGSYAGDGIQNAINSGYKQIYSIELSQIHYDMCKNRFKDRSDVFLIFGDSCEVLEPTISSIDQTITFWLDGHYSCGKTAKGKYWSPLMQELQAIKKHKLNNHTIMIDDMRCWNENNPEFKFGKVQIEQKLLEINSNYKFEYFFGVEENDILVASL